MWQHEILEKLERNTKRTFWNMGDVGKNNIKFCLEMFGSDEVPVFYMGKASEVNVQIGKGEKFDHLPFPDMIFEYEQDQPSLEGEESCRKRAIILHTEENGDIIIVPIVMYASVNMWLMESLYGLVTPGDYDAGVRVGFLIDNVMERGLPDGTTEEGFRHSLERDCMAEIAMAYKFLKILNARNIVIKTVLPPERLNHARVKRQKHPLRQYKILEVVKGVVKNKNAGTVDWEYRSPRNSALHVCRGHFKTYTKEAPLFGRFMGTFWWQPQVRGSIENGEIIKDYEVKYHG